MSFGLSDAQQIDNLLQDTSLESIKYNDRQLAFITDINNLSYQDRITFSTTVLKQQLVDYHSAFFAIPITVTRANLLATNFGSKTATGAANDDPTTAWDYMNTQVDTAAGQNPGQQTSYLKGRSANETLLCCRDSVLNFIAGIIVQTDQGQTIVNEYGYMDFINNLRLKIENDINWMQNIGSLIHFSLDTVASSKYQSGTVTQIDPRNNNVNPFQPDVNMQNGIYSAWPASHVPSTNSTTPIRITTVASSTAAWVHTTGVVTFSAAVAVPAMVGGFITIDDTTNTLQNALIIGYTDTTHVTTAIMTIATVTASTNFEVVYNPAGSATNGTSTTVSNITPIAVRNPGYNKGADERCQIFLNASSYVQGVQNTNPGSYNLILKIPLRMLHDFWEQVDFPIINMGFNIQLLLRQYNNTSLASSSAVPQQPLYVNNTPPLMVCSLYGGNGTSTQALWTGGQPAVRYGDTSVGAASNKNYGTGCRLYYEVVKLNPTENEMFKNKLQRGFTKKIKFISTDVFKKSTLTSGTDTQLIAPAIVWPLRVWAMLFTANAATAINDPYSALGGGWLNTVPSTTGVTGSGATTTSGSAFGAQNGLQVVHGWLTNANILVNNQQYFRNNLQTPDDFWCQFKDQVNRNLGSLISYQDYITLFRYHCFDLSRLSERLPSKTESVSLSITYDRADTTGAACDLLCLIERMNQVQIDFATSDCTVTVGNITA